MSILVVHLVREGLLFGADRNVTASREDGDVERVGQVQRPKMLKWPNREAIIGYVGDAEIGTTPADEWLYAFIGRHLGDEEFAVMARALTDDLNASMATGQIRGPLILHLGGFERWGDEWTPQVWYVHNTSGLREDGAYIAGDEFVFSEELGKPAYFDGRTGNQIRDEVRRTVEQWQPFSFRQGYDLGAFNVLDHVIRMAMKAIVETHPRQLHPFPTDLAEWSKHVRLAIHGYGAYFAAFFEPFEQYVGGGADVVAVPWPNDAA